MSKLSLISRALYLCHRARSCLDDLPSKADESFQFEQHLKDVTVSLLNPSASAVVDITVIYPWPLTAGNLCAPYSCVVFAGHHAPNEVTKEEDDVAVAENVLQVRLITARGVCMCQTCEYGRWKTVFLLVLRLGRRHRWEKSLGWWAPGKVLSGPLAFLIASFAGSLEKRLAQIHLGGETL